MSSTPIPGASSRADASHGEDLAFSGRWGESIERSRARRMAAAIKRRRRFRSHGAVMSAVAVLAVSGAGAGVAGAQSGAASGTYLTVGSSGSQVTAVENALGVSADGYFDKQLAQSVRGFQSENGLVVDGIVGPETSAALGLSSSPAEPTGGEAAGGTGATGGSSAPNATLEQIAQCESGGDPSAVSADGQYRGKYQFSRETWAALGGTGDPAAAPESVQDEMAAKLYAQSGTSSWPSCG